MSRPNILTVFSDKVHTRGGGIQGARRLARREGLPIHHMHSDGRLVIVWYDEHDRPRQRTYPKDRVRVIHNGEQFFLMGA
jgi:hypothetical protein